MAAAKPVVPIDETRASLALEWAKIMDRIQPDLDRAAAIKVELETLPVSKYSIPGVELKVDVSQSYTFKPDLFAARYPVSVRPDLYKAVPDADKIKATFAPADLAAFTKASKPSVKLV